MINTDLRGAVGSVLFLPAIHGAADLCLGRAVQLRTCPKLLQICTRTAGPSCAGLCCPWWLPGIIAGCILVFVPSLGAFLAPDLLGGAKNWMIGSLIEDQFKGAAGNWPFGAAASMILLSMVLLVLFFYARRQARAEEA